jgi:hypothetical protein
MEQAKKGTSRPSDLPQDATCYLAEKKETFERPIKSLNQAACWGLMPVILATQGQRSGGSRFKASPGKNQAPI